MVKCMHLECRIEERRLAAPFRISGYVFEKSNCVVVELSDGDHRGRGEAAGVYYLSDLAPQIVKQIEANRDLLERCKTREELRQVLPPGGARNALDSALWELEASRLGRPVWQLAGITKPRPLITTFTVGADEPEKMVELARGYAQAKAIKVKLTGELEFDIARLSAVRGARPDVWIGVDANQGFKIGDLGTLVEALIEQKVSLIEQPLARGSEADLEGFDSPIPIAADESAQSLEDVARLAGRFDVFSIKLDKCGGLTEALLIVEEARRIGLGVMVGNMGGTSLAMAPAFVVGQHCDIVDLDGPLFLEEDRTPAVHYKDGAIWCPDEVWGSGALVRQ